MLARRGGTVLGIDVKENSGAALEAVDEFGLTFPNLRDRDGSFVRKWGQTRLSRELRDRPRRQGRRRAPLARHPGVARRDAAAAAGRVVVMRALLAALLALAARRAAAAAAEPRASLPDIEDEVMCLECGTALNVSNSDVADQERDFIAGLIAQGRTKAADQGRARRRVRPARAGRARRRRLPAHRVARADRSRRSAALALVLLVARRWRGAAPRRRPRRRRPGPRRRRRAPPRCRARGLRPMSDGVDTTIVAAFAVGFVSFISPMRAAARPRLPLGRLRRERRSSCSAASARSSKVLLPAIVFCLSFTVVFVALGHDGDRARLDAAGLARHAGQDRRRGDHRARRAVPAHAVRAEAQPRMAAGRADQRAPARAAR